MGIIDLRSNLTSLKFGRDTRGGGSSDQPYVTKSIPDELPPTSKDFLLRNGYLHFDSVADDVERLTKYFTDTKDVSGLLFTVKQEMLSRMGVKTEASPEILNEDVYLPLNTVAQAAIVSTGGHLNKQGVDPITYGQVASSNNFDGNNRILQLVKKHITPYKQGTDGNEVEILRYDGGPESKLGFGDTIIRYGTTAAGSKLSVNNYAIPIGFQSLLGKGATFTYEMLDVEIPPTVDGRGTSLSEIPDFRQAIRNRGARIVYSDYLNFNRESTFKTSNIGRRGKDLTDPNNRHISFLSTSDPSLADAIQKLDVRYDTDEQNTVVQELLKTDIVQFSIKVLNNDTPTLRDFIVFRANLDSLIDNVSSETIPFSYVGRGDKFYRNVGFERNINLSFKVHCQSRQEQRGMYNKLNQLQSTLAPDYSDNGFARTNIVRLTIGDYIKDVPGIITNLTYTLPIDHAWDIGRSERGELVGPQLPMYVEVSTFDFVVIHDFIPARAKSLTDKPFISGVTHSNLGYYV